MIPTLIPRTGIIEAWQTVKSILQSASTLPTASDIAALSVLAMVEKLGGGMGGVYKA